MAFHRRSKITIQQSLDTWLRPIAANAGIDDLLIFDAAGQGVLRLSLSKNNANTTYIASAPPDLSTWSGVQSVIHARKDALGDKFIDLISDDSPPSKTYSFYISAPVVSQTGDSVGGIALGLTAAHLTEQITSEALSPVTLYGANGQPLGTTLRVTPETIPLSEADARQLGQDVQSASVIHTVNFGDAPYQVLYTPFQLRGQTFGLLAVALSSNFIVERSSTSRDIFAVIFSALFAAVALLGVVTGRSISRPVARLVMTTRAIRGGDLSKRITHYTPDELGELGESFDEMTDILVRRNIAINDLYVHQLEETARLDTILSSISDAVIVQTPVGEMILKNRTAETLLKTLDAKAEARRDFDQLRQSPTALFQPRTVALTEFYFSVLAASITLPSGDLFGYVIVLRDITPMVEAERLKDELILQMSHELRTPLAAARGYIDLTRMFEQAHLTEQGNGFIDQALNSLSMLERMVSQVIDVSAVMSNEFSLALKTINLAQLLGTCVAEWLPHAAERELTLSLNPPDSQLEIEADEIRLAQVFDHVLRNAVSYTLPGGAVWVSAARDVDKMIITIADTGVGIGAEEIDKVFERMYRGRSADAGPTDTRGLGLGLYISKRIIVAHHGTITLSSQLEKGTTVTIMLPVRQPKN